MPWPSSDTRIVIAPELGAFAEMDVTEASGLYLSALSIKLNRTCSRAWRLL